MLSPWMQSGNILKYLARYPEVDRLKLVCIWHVPMTLLIDMGLLQAENIADGMEYLHGLNPAIVHGDIKGVSTTP
jgi:hypothetical protein